MSELRKAYIFKPQAAGLGGMTPPGDIEPAALTIVEYWNTAIPANHVRVLTSPRFWDLRAALAVFTRDEIIAAIRFYARQAWNRERQVWRTFDSFIAMEHLTIWVERAADAAERSVARASVAQASRLRSEIPAPEDHSVEARRRYDALPVDRRRDLSNLARRALGPEASPEAVTAWAAALANGKQGTPA